jgi:hypothetical protein
MDESGTSIRAYAARRSLEAPNCTKEIAITRVAVKVTGTRSFGPELFGFLRDLKANNDREWFNANKERYEKEMRDPALDFVEDFAPYLAEISTHFVADPRPSGGSLFRIYRDTRFSKNLATCSNAGVRR